MEEIKIFLQKEKERLNNRKKLNDLCERGYGKLNLIHELENLIICSSSLQLPSKEVSFSELKTRVKKFKDETHNKLSAKTIVGYRLGWFDCYNDIVNR